MEYGCNLNQIWSKSRHSGDSTNSAFFTFDNYFSSYNLINNPGFLLVSIGLYLLLSCGVWPSLCFVMMMLHRGSKWLKPAKNKLPKVISRIFQSKFQHIHISFRFLLFHSLKIEWCLIFHQKGYRVFYFNFGCQNIKVQSNIFI